MKLLNGFGLISIVYGLGLTPLAGHAGHHHSHCQGSQAQRQLRGDGNANGSINLETVERKVAEVVYLP